jgi:hypothetical protein
MTLCSISLSIRLYVPFYIRSKHMASDKPCSENIFGKFCTHQGYNERVFISSKTSGRKRAVEIRHQALSEFISRRRPCSSTINPERTTIPPSSPLPTNNCENFKMTTVFVRYACTYPPLSSQPLHALTLESTEHSGLAYATTEETVRKAFEKHSAVADVAIVTDRDTGRSRGFGFVTFDSEDEASNAVQKLDGTE